MGDGLNIYWAESVNCFSNSVTNQFKKEDLTGVLGTQNHSFLILRSKIKKKVRTSKIR